MKSTSSQTTMRPKWKVDQITRMFSSDKTVKLSNKKKKSKYVQCTIMNPVQPLNRHIQWADLGNCIFSSLLPTSVKDHQ